MVVVVVVVVVVAGSRTVDKHAITLVPIASIASLWVCYRDR